jgi:hypothetical protein
MKRAFFAFILAGSIAACGGSPAHVSAPTTSTPSEAHGSRFTISTVEDLELRTAAAKARSPGWEIHLDPFGMLAEARHPLLAIDGWNAAIGAPELGPHTSGVVVSRDEWKVLEEFIAAQEEILRLASPGVEQRFDGATGIGWAQSVDGVVAAFVRADKVPLPSGYLRVMGHAWPDLAPTTPALDAPVLEAKLHALDTTPDLVTVRRFVEVDVGKRQVQLREALCLYTDADRRQPAKAPLNLWGPKRPCVDVGSGEDLSARQVGWRTEAENGRITHVEMTR